MYYRDQLFIDGQWSTPDSGTAIDVISPHSQEVIGRVSFAGPADVDRAVQAARTAFDGGPGRGCSPLSASPRSPVWPNCTRSTAATWRS
jgi:hypothetical protein